MPWGGTPRTYTGAKRCWGSQEAAWPARFAVPLHGPSQWLFLATEDWQIPLPEEKQSCWRGWGEAGPGADVCLPLTLTRAAPGWGRHPLLGAVPRSQVPRLPLPSPWLHVPPAAARLALGAALRWGGGRWCPPAQVQGGCPAVPGCSTAPPLPSPWSRSQSHPVTTALAETRSRQHGSHPPTELRRAAMWHRPRERLPANKGVHPWTEPNPHAPGCCQTSLP